MSLQMTGKPRKGLLVSKMTGKLEGLQAINTNTLTNLFCQAMRKTSAICKICYSWAMLTGSRKNCAAPWQRNGEILSSGPLPARDIPRIDTVLGRFQAHGELINRQHAANLLEIARSNPDTRFGFWTKLPGFVRGMEIPENVTLVYSNPIVDRIMTKPPRGFHKVFNCVTDDRAEINCGPLKCRDCKMCYGRTTGATVIVEKVKVRN